MVTCKSSKSAMVMHKFKIWNGDTQKVQTAKCGAVACGLKFWKRSLCDAIEFIYSIMQENVSKMQNVGSNNSS